MRRDGFLREKCRPVERRWMRWVEFPVLDNYSVAKLQKVIQNGKLFMKFFGLVEKKWVTLHKKI